VATAAAAWPVLLLLLLLLLLVAMTLPLCDSPSLLQLQLQQHHPAPACHQAGKQSEAQPCCPATGGLSAAQSQLLPRHQDLLLPRDLPSMLLLLLLLLLNGCSGCC
jgi:hypothetical protein